MNIYTPLSFFAFLLCMYMGIYVIRLNSKTLINRVFLGLSLSMAIWNFAYIFIYPDLDKSHVFFWYKITAFGWAIFPAFILHFFLLLAQKEQFRKFRWWILVYLPGIIFTIRAMTGGFLAVDFEPGPGHALYEIQDTKTIWYNLYVVYLWIYVFSGVLLFAAYSRKTTVKKIKSQSRIFLVAVFVLFVVISTTNLVFPLLNIKVVPAIGNIILIFWMLTIWYAIVKYKLMAFTIESAANELIAEMNELLFFVDTDGRIIKVNNFTELSLELNPPEIINSNFSGLVMEHEKVREILGNIGQTGHWPDVTLTMKKPQGKDFPVVLSFSGIRDKLGDLLGTLIVGHDITLTIQLQQEIEFRRKAEQKIQQQNEVLTMQKKELENTLEDLKNTQTQLIQAEKMASLGELTAGIAHEIQNPLNFVTNFSEIGIDLLQELNEELEKGDVAEATAIADDLKQNLGKIIQHGKRADSIIKSMLQHSRGASGIKLPTDINTLCDEFFRLAYHGFRARDKSFNATLLTEFDPSIEKINVVSQDIGRVVLNLINNAFHAVNDRKKLNEPGYAPTVWVSTKQLSQTDEGQKGPVGPVGIEIRVKDNGTGIPQEILDKIFQPFFTTKPMGEGTGLGLSLSYEIVTKGHGGELKVETEAGKGTTFIVLLPV